MRVFITGATGFAGSHLVQMLLAEEHHVTALVHPASSHQGLPSHALIEAIEGDLLDPDSVQECISRSRPDVIYHLAGQAYPGRSWKEPALTLAINAGGTANVLQAAVEFGRPRVVVVTSAEIYADVRPEDLPIRESSVPEPGHPYGVSKWASGQLAALYWRHFKLPVMEARPFNHIGPNQAIGFVVTDFASQLAAVHLGRRPPSISVGNLEARRDFTDVRDVARAYMMLAESGRPGEKYLICSGKAISIRRLLDLLIEINGVEVTVVYDQARMRPSDTPCLYGSYEKIEAHTGWRPQIELRRSLSDALDDWMNRLAVTD